MMASSESEEKTRFPARLLYLGLSKQGSGKHANLWYFLKSCKFEEVENNGSKLKSEPDRRAIFDKFHPYNCLPGSIYTIDTNEDGNSIYLKTERDPDSWENKDDLLLWQSRYKMDLNNQKSEAMAKKMAKNDVVLDTLEKLRNVYLSLSYNQRESFLCMCVSKIQKH